MSRPVRSERVTRAQQHCQLEKSLQFLLRDCSASYEFATSVWIQGFPGLSLGQSPKCLTVASKSKKKSFPFTPFWSSNCESTLAAHAHGTAVPKQISALHWDISRLAALSVQTVRARCTFKNLSASSHSKGKKPNHNRVTHVVQLSLHEGHVCHLEETDSAEAPHNRSSFSLQRQPARSSLTML